MTKEEIENWIENNCPTEWDNYGLKVKIDMWRNGARAMAEHLSSSEKDNNLDTPPTKEYLEKVLDLFFWACETYFPDDNEQEQYIDYIIKNWSDEQKRNR